MEQNKQPDVWSAFAALLSDIIARHFNEIDLNRLPAFRLTGIFRKMAERIREYLQARRKALLSGPSLRYDFKLRTRSEECFVEQKAPLDKPEPP